MTIKENLGYRFALTTAASCEYGRWIDGFRSAHRQRRSQQLERQKQESHAGASTCDPIGGSTVYVADDTLLKVRLSTRNKRVVIMVTFRRLSVYTDPGDKSN